jgi:hypothetical protein
VEVALGEWEAAVRDSKNTDGQVLVVSPASWRRFVDEIV